MLVQNVSYWAIFGVAHNQIRQQVKQSLPKIPLNECLRLVFPAQENYNSSNAKQLNWQHAKEFAWEGNLYDVRHSFVENNLLYIYCLQDRKEESLFALFDLVPSLDKQTEPIKNRTALLLLAFPKQFLNTPFLCFAVKFNSSLYFLDNTQTALLPFYNVTYTSYCLNVSPPPPESALV